MINIKGNITFDVGACRLDESELNIYPYLHSTRDAAGPGRIVLNRAKAGRAGPNNFLIR